MTWPHHFLHTSDSEVQSVLFHLYQLKLFKQAAPKIFIINSLNECLQKYQTEVEKILRIFLKAFSHGLIVQKGATFCFGPTAFVTTFCKSVTVIDVCECELPKYEIKFLPYSSDVKFLPALWYLKSEELSFNDKHVLLTNLTLMYSRLFLPASLLPLPK